MKTVVKFNGHRIGHFIYDIWHLAPQDAMHDVIHDVLFVHSLQLYPKFRGRGLFKHLLNEIKKVAVELNIKKIALAPASPLGEPHNTNLYFLYTRYGFKPWDGLLALTLEED